MSLILWIHNYLLDTNSLISLDFMCKKQFVLVQLLLFCMSINITELNGKCQNSSLLLCFNRYFLFLLHRLFFHHFLVPFINFFIFFSIYIYIFMIVKHEKNIKYPILLEMQFMTSNHKALYNLNEDQL